MVIVFPYYTTWNVFVENMDYKSILLQTRRLTVGLPC